MTEATRDSADRNAGVEHTGGGEMPKAVQRELPNPGSAPQSNKGERHSVGAPGSGTVGFGAEDERGVRQAGINGCGALHTAVMVNAEHSEGLGIERNASSCVGLGVLDHERVFSHPDHRG